MRVRATGHGQPLLMIMGLGGTIEMWDPLIRCLPNRHTIAFDAPGTGQSALPRRPLRMQELAELCESLLDELGYAEVDVLGFSFGGAIAQQLAAYCPDRVRRLVLAATVPGLGGLPGNPIALSLLAFPPTYLSPTLFATVAPLLFGGSSAKGAIGRRNTFMRFAESLNLLGSVMQATAMVGWSSMHFLHRIRRPVLVLAGDDDPLVPLINARLLATLVPVGRLQVVPGGGHLFLIEQPAECAQLIEAFLT